jgi:hypothetical protein
MKIISVALFICTIINYGECLKDINNGYNGSSVKTLRSFTSQISICNIIEDRVGGLSYIYKKLRKCLLERDVIGRLSSI